MTETAQEYVERIHRCLGNRGPLSVQRRTPASLARKIAGVPRRVLTRSPAKGKWSIAQILAHLAETELAWGYRIRKILEENGVPLQGYDQDRWEAISNYQTIDPKDSLELFRSLRRRNLALLGSLSPSALRRFGRHSQFGKLTISGIAKLLAGHDINHTRQIDAILKHRPRSME
jgi:uncharacterized damage-inducible protein DinB